MSPPWRSRCLVTRGQWRWRHRQNLLWQQSQAPESNEWGTPAPNNEAEIKLLMLIMKIHKISILGPLLLIFSFHSINYFWGWLNFQFCIDAAKIFWCEILSNVNVILTPQMWWCLLCCSPDIQGPVFTIFWLKCCEVKVRSGSGPVAVLTYSKWLKES